MKLVLAHQLQDFLAQMHTPQVVADKDQFYLNPLPETCNQSLRKYHLQIQSKDHTCRGLQI